MACSKINPILTDIVNEHLCVGIVSGLYKIWWYVAFAAIVLWVGMCWMPSALHSESDDEAKKKAKKNKNLVHVMPADDEGVGDPYAVPTDDGLGACIGMSVDDAAVSVVTEMEVLKDLEEADGAEEAAGADDHVGAANPDEMEPMSVGSTEAEGE